MKLLAPSLCFAGPINQQYLCQLFPTATVTEMLLLAKFYLCEESLELLKYTCVVDQHQSVLCIWPTVYFLVRVSLSPTFAVATQSVARYTMHAEVVLQLLL